MKYFKNFKEKENLSKQEEELKDKNKIVFFEDIDKNDWYFTLKFLDDKETYKLCLDANNKVILVEKDATLLFPVEVGCSILEIEVLPENFSLNSRWFYDEEINELYQKELTQEEIIKVNSKIQSDLIKQAQNLLIPYQYKYDLTVATKEDINCLNRIKKFIVELYSVDLTLKEPMWPKLGV